MPKPPHVPAWLSEGRRTAPPVLPGRETLHGTPTSESPSSKELKVKITARLHVQLQAWKILHGQPIHATVAAALDDYFREHPTTVLTWRPSADVVADARQG